VERARRGDTGVFHEVVDRFAPALYALAVSLVGNAADAEDVVQETFTGAFRGLRRFRQDSSLKTWLTRILCRQTAAHHRRTKRHRDRVIRLDETVGPELAATGAATPDVRMDIDLAIGSLSPEHREVIILREREGMTYNEIAEALGIPRGTVESRLFRARRDLQERLGAYAPDRRARG